MKKLVHILLLLFSGSFISASDVIYVNHNSPKGGDGVSWETAHKYLQDALEESSSGDEIWIASGTYYADDGSFVTDNDRIESFILIDQLSIYGGFNGDELSLEERNLDSNSKTIFSGDIDQDDDLSDNSYHIMITGENNLIDGITFTSGNANGSYADGSGAAIYCGGSNLTINNCIFSGNFSESHGGAIYGPANSIISKSEFNGNTSNSGMGGAISDISASIISDSDFINNSAYGHGGAVYSGYEENQKNNFIDCTFNGNSTSNDSGGAVYGFNSFENTSFVNNSARNSGGALMMPVNDVDSDQAYYEDETRCPQISYCLFQNNEALHADGGAIYGNVNVQDSTFSNNYSRDEGGAICGRILSLRNHFTSNEVFSYGAALFLKGSSGDSYIYNTEFTGNFTQNHGHSRGGAIFSEHDLIIVDTIFDGNYSRNGGGSIYANASSNLKVYSSLFSNNSSQAEGGAIRHDTRAEFINCTFDKNRTTGQTGRQTFYSDRGGDISHAIFLVNCIVWGNEDNSFSHPPYLYDSFDAVPNIFSSMPYTLPESVNGDPFFQNPNSINGLDGILRTKDDGYSLRSVSVSVDSGLEIPVTFFADRFDADNDGDTDEGYPFDIKGYLRSQGDSVDIGAYEYGESFRINANILPEGSGMVSGLGDFNVGLSTNLNAVAIPGYLFSHWVSSITGEEIYESNIELIVDSNKSFTVNFVLDNNDNDNDGLTNYEENILYNTSDSNSDTDNDSIPDNLEIISGLDPLFDNSAVLDMFNNNISLLDIESALIPIDEYNSVLAQRDSRPTQVAYDEVQNAKNIALNDLFMAQSEINVLQTTINDLNLFKDNANSNLTSYILESEESFNLAQNVYDNAVFAYQDSLDAANDELNNALAAFSIQEALFNTVLINPNSTQEELTQAVLQFSEATNLKTLAESQHTEKVANLENIFNEAEQVYLQAQQKHNLVISSPIEALVADLSAIQLEYNAVIAERDSKLTLDEVKDLRSGSTMIEIHNGQATLTMEVEESNDLGVWTNGSATSIQIPIDAEAGKRFFRFKMAE